MHHSYLPSAHGEKGVGGESEVHASCSLILQDGMSARIAKDRLRQTCGLPQRSLGMEPFLRQLRVSLKLGSPLPEEKSEWTCARPLEVFHSRAACLIFPHAVWRTWFRR